VPQNPGWHLPGLRCVRGGGPQAPPTRTRCITRTSLMQAWRPLARAKGCSSATDSRECCTFLRARTRGRRSSACTSDMDWCGTRSSLAAKLAGDSYVAFAPDLFSRWRGDREGLARGEVRVTCPMSTSVLSSVEASIFCAKVRGLRMRAASGLFCVGCARESLDHGGQQADVERLGKDCLDAKVTGRLRQFGSGGNDNNRDIRRA
jgi:hypothetical protein